MQDSMTEARNRILIGSAWLLAVQGVERLIGLVSVTILARLLTLTDLGVVALAGTLVASVEHVVWELSAVLI
jgi:O-antigen/teichoic acid export membrane protein